MSVTGRTAALVLSAVLACAGPAAGASGAGASVGRTATASSATTLVLDRPTATYGREVTATAAVTTATGAPDGHVAFSVDGLALTAVVGPDGIARLVLPAAGVGAHSVTATFVPRDPTTYAGSSSAPQALTVVKVRSRLPTRTTGKTTAAPTRVQVRARGIFDTVATGRVRITLKRNDRSGGRVATRRLDDGAAEAGFGRLRKGRYLVVVVYRGDGQHLATSTTRRFRVESARTRAASARVARVATSSTSLVLSTATSAYGQNVTATASVSATPGPPEGDVVFSLDGVATKANLGASGTATLVLPRSAVGQHAVSATFVPQFPASQQSSTSPVQGWTVAPVRTRLQVRVIGKGARIPTSVRVGAAGEYGTRPSGRVSMVVRRIASGPTTTRARTLSDSAVAQASFGRLRTGRYRLVVTYAGDAEHLLERQFVRFRVRQR